MNLDQYLQKYSESHQHPTNKLIHRICVPLIFVGIFFMIFSIPIPEKRSLILNPAVFIYLFCLVFWFRLSKKIGYIFIAVGLFLSILTNFVWIAFCLTLDLPLLKIGITMFVLGWIGQIIGHKIEGKKPSFLDDIKFLLIGPIWIFKK